MSTIIGVMGAGKALSEEEQQTAYRLGYLIAEKGWILLTGGRNAGVMEAASQGARTAAGIVIGILPDADQSTMSKAVNIPIITGIGHARNVVNILSSDIVVACGEPGAGTASEICLALKIAKPVILLNTNEEALQFFRWLGGSAVSLATKSEEVIQQIEKTLGNIKEN